MGDPTIRKSTRVVTERMSAPTVPPESTSAHLPGLLLPKDAPRSGGDCILQAGFPPPIGGDVVEGHEAFDVAFLVGLGLRLQTPLPCYSSVLAGGTTARSMGQHGYPAEHTQPSRGLGLEGKYPGESQSGRGWM